MILTEEQIKQILNKEPKIVKYSLGDLNLKEYNYTEKELCDLIETYIYEKKGVKIKELKLSQGVCPSFMNIVIKKLGMFEAMQRSDSLIAFNYASWYCMRYYIEKFKENG